MRFAFSTIKTNDLEASVSFYQDILGLVEERRIYPREGMCCVFLKDENNSVVELIGSTNDSVNNEESKGHVSLGFAVEDLDKVIEMLKDNNINIISGPINTPGGERLLFIEDPNGVEIEFVEGFKL